MHINLRIHLIILIMAYALGCESSDNNATRAIRRPPDNVEQIITFAAEQMAGHENWIADFQHLAHDKGIMAQTDGKIQFCSPHLLRIESTTEVLGSAVKALMVEGKDRTLWIETSTHRGANITKVDMRKSSLEDLSAADIDVSMLQMLDIKAMRRGARKDFDFVRGEDEQLDGHKMYIVKGTLRKDALSREDMNLFSSISGEARIVIGQEDGHVYAFEKIMKCFTKKNPNDELSSGEAFGFQNIKTDQPIAATLFDYQPRPKIEVTELTPKALKAIKKKAADVQGCMESEYFLSADVNPVSGDIYFISQHDLLVNNNPPFNPTAIQCELALEKIRPDGKGRTCLMNLLPGRTWAVDPIESEQQMFFIAPAHVRFRLAPSGRKALLENFLGEIYLLDLERKQVAQIKAVQGILAPPGDKAVYNYAYTFVAWTQDSHLLLIRQKYKWEYGGGSPVDSALISCTENGTDEKIIYTFHKPVFSAEMAGERLLINEMISVGIDTTNLSLSDWRRVSPSLHCKELLPMHGTNLWITSERKVIDSNFHVVREIGVKSGSLQAWSKGGAIVTDTCSGLMLVNNIDGDARILIPSFINKPAKHVTVSSGTPSEINNHEVTKTPKEDVSPHRDTAVVPRNESQVTDQLLSRLLSHDTTVLPEAKIILLHGDPLGWKIVFKMLQANWSAANDLIGEVLLEQTDMNTVSSMIDRISNLPTAANLARLQTQGQSSQARVKSKTPQWTTLEQFEKPILLLASDCSKLKVSAAGHLINCLRRMKGPEVELRLVAFAKEYPSYEIRDRSLNTLKVMNKSLYRQTLLGMTNDQEFICYFPIHNLTNDTSPLSIRAKPE